MNKYCPRCGYISRSGETELKCPLCGKKLSFGLPPSSEGTCDQNIEKEFNNNYHDDFQEGRKTGEYCDPRFERYTNGGDHYHGTEKETYNEEVSYNRKTSSAEPRYITELPDKAQWIITVMLSVFFPVFGPIILIIAINKVETSRENKNRIKKKAKICLLLTCILFVIKIIFAFVSYSFV